VKTQATLLALGLVFALQTATAQSTNSIASTTTATAQGQPAPQNKVEPPKAPPVDRSQIMRLEGVSSQPWNVIATRRDNSSGFHDAKEHEPQLCVCLLGRKPQ
jgi:hypothetical protein